MLTEPPVVVATATLDAAVATLREADPSAVIVVDAEGRAIGLVDAATPDIMGAVSRGDTAALCRDDVLLHEAVRQLRRERRTALGVVDAAGKPVGLLTADAAMAPLLRSADDLLTDGPWTAARRTSLAAALLQDGQDPVGVQTALSGLDDGVMQRTIEACMQAMRADGWGAPPVAFAVLIMGSGGRRESFLHPDQDNGFVLADYADELHDTIDRYFIELATRYTAALDAAGVPLCRGFVMATNPVWRKTISQWESQVAGWALSASPQAVLNADIFLDFRTITGVTAPAGGAPYDAGLGERLRASVLRICAEFPLLLKQVAWEHVQRGVPVGLFGNLLPDHGDTESHRHGGTIDLKLRATMPLIGLVRMLALRHGVAATATLERLRALIQDGYVSREFGSLLIEDFHTVAGLRLRQQVSDHAAGRPIGNQLRLAELSERDRARLVQAFRSIDTLRKVAAQAFGGRTG